MPKLFIVYLILGGWFVFSFLSSDKVEKSIPSYKEKLSDYGFFEGKLNEQMPVSHVLPYSLNAPLFSDYAHKLRFVDVPKNTTIVYNPDSVFQFPIGTAMVKTFFYYKDERTPKKGRRLIETRILLHEPKGWVALPYIWDEQQTDAYIEVTGGDTKVNWQDTKGLKHDLEYHVPNMNQCKGCHERNGVMTPIGPSARQLNGEFQYPDKLENQLKRWANVNALVEVPDDLSLVPKMVNYDLTQHPMNARARSYLDVNCAHCHNNSGPAQSSGLFLDWHTRDSTAYGFFKTPVAAGRGSGNLSYDIVPGKPQESILWYRMLSRDPGVMMPELGRKMEHTEGIKLIKDWIKGM